MQKSDTTVTNLFNATFGNYIRGSLSKTITRFDFTQTVRDRSVAGRLPKAIKEKSP